MKDKKTSISKKELMDLIVDNFLFNGVLHLTNLEIPYAIDISGMRCAGDLIQNDQIAEGNIFQNNQRAQQSLFQNNQEAYRSIHQENQEAECIYQKNQRAKKIEPKGGTE